MANSINNKFIKTQANQRPAQVFDINLNTDLISSLQNSINSLNAQFSETYEKEEINLTDEDTSLETNTKPKVSYKEDQVSSITRRDKNPNNNYEGQSRRTFKKGADLTVNAPEQSVSDLPSIQVPFLERQALGSETQNSDGSIIQTKKNNDGTTTETYISNDGSTLTKTFQDFPLDKKGNPTGFRTTIIDNNYSVINLSTIINDLGNGNFSTVTTDLTDPGNPRHVSSSALVKNPEVKDDAGNFLYNSDTNRADGLSEIVTHENLTFDDSDGLNRPAGYRSFITNYNTITKLQNSIITETISYTDENGKRVTTVFDVTDPNNLVELSKTFRDDPFTAKKKTGSGISTQLDKIKQWGLLDITGDNSLDPSSDLLLIARYLKGFRGSELTNNINLSENSNSVEKIESNISKLLNRGLLDIVGTNEETNNDDLKILARYMMGARNDVLLSKKKADDDSIKINNDGSNVLTIEDSSPLLSEIQDIFGVTGKKLEFNNGNGQKQNYRLFFVDTINQI
jgi:hypothetical protein